jgi:hypothetical protein
MSGSAHAQLIASMTRVGDRFLQLLQGYGAVSVAEMPLADGVDAIA